MAQRKILVDSNSYFRLAKEIHPLLFQEFGSDCYCLYVLDELQQEYERSSRLKTQFGWVNDPEFVENRKKRLAVSKQQKKDIGIAQEHLWDHVLNVQPGPSRVDTVVLSYGLVLAIPVVTDDIDLGVLAKTFGATVITTLDLMKLMLDCGHINLAQVRRICCYWSYANDRPANFSEDYRRLFGESPPP